MVARAYLPFNCRADEAIRSERARIDLKRAQAPI